MRRVGYPSFPPVNRARPILATLSGDDAAPDLKKMTPERRLTL